MIKNLSRIFLLMLIIACTEETEIGPETQMPPYTEIGAFTGGYRVDGRLVIAYDEEGKPSSLSSYYTKIDGNSNLTISIRNRSRYNWEFVQIQLYNIQDTGVYYARNRCERCDSNSIYYYNQRYPTGTTFYATKNHLGYIRITKLDKVNRIVSGRFHFTGKLFELGDEKDTVRVTDGQFDTKWD